MKFPAIAIILSLTAFVGLPQSRSFTGEIMDSPCAAMRTHDRMMKGMDAKDAKDCTQKCAHAGAAYVLYDPSSKTMYNLDDQQKADAYAGQKVTVKGTYDSASKTIHIGSIEAR